MEEFADSPFFPKQISDQMKSQVGSERSHGVRIYVKDEERDGGQASRAEGLKDSGHNHCTWPPTFPGCSCKGVLARRWRKSQQ